MKSTDKTNSTDFGLGKKPSSKGYRILNKDGTFNLKKINIPFFEKYNIFHALITMKWHTFFGCILLLYFIVNFVFAAIYYSIGVENLTGTSGMSHFEEFMEGFFFSAQTVTTLGYGRVAPLGLLANSIAAIESLLGLLFFALATGLLYGRFSKPQSKILFTDNAVVAPYQDINAFMFRIVNPQSNELLEAEVSVIMAIKQGDTELRDYHNLTLERSKIVFFPSLWTIVHPIDDSSPLKALTQNDFITKDVEFIIALKAFDEDSGQMVYSRSSYKPNEVLWGKKFLFPVTQKEGRSLIDISRINDTEKSVLN